MREMPPGKLTAAAIFLEIERIAAMSPEHKSWRRMTLSIHRGIHGKYKSRRLNKWLERLGKDK